MNRLRCLIILVMIFAPSLFAQTNKIPEGYEDVLERANAGDWSQAWIELENVGILIVEVWDALMYEAIRQDNHFAASELVQRAYAAEIIEQSTQFSVCPFSPSPEGSSLATFTLMGGQEQVVFDPPTLTPIGTAQYAEDLDTSFAERPDMKAALLDEVATVLNFDPRN